MRKLTEAIQRGAAQARSVVGAASAGSELVLLPHRFPSDHPRFGRRSPELSVCVVRVSAACRVLPGVAVPRWHEFASSNACASLLFERRAEVAVPQRRQHNAPVSLGESGALERTVVASHSPSRGLLVAHGVRTLAVSAGVSRTAAVLSLFHRRSNPSIEGTSTSKLRLLVAAPHVKR